MENQIKISSSVTKIKVNESGDTIELNLNDQEFVARLVETTKQFEADARELNKKHSANDDLEAVAKASIDLCRNWKSALDNLLGEGTCEKVFGPITPGVDAFAEFFSQLGDILAREQTSFAKTRGEKIAKYTAKYQKYHKGG